MIQLDEFNKRFYYDLRRTDNDIDLFEIDKINYDTPMNLFVKTFCNCDLTHYITHSEVTTNEKKMLFIFRERIVLTKYIEDFAKVDYTNNDIVDTKIDYIQIYYLDYEVYDDTKNLILRLHNHSDVISFTNMVFTYKSFRELTLALHFIKKQMTLTWQRLFETFIPLQEPLVYRSHFFVQKINNRGKLQNRVIVLSNYFLYNVSYRFDLQSEAKNFEVEELKWPLAVESFKSITVSKKKKFTIVLLVDKAVNKKRTEEFSMKATGHKEREFMFYLAEDMKLFIFACKAAYFSLKKQYLQVKQS